MTSVVETALTADISSGVRAVCVAAVQEAQEQAVMIVGDGPAPGTPEWGAEEGSTIVEERQQAWALASLRLQLAAGLDGLNEVILLRRMGVTWALIGRAADMTRQSAHERWGHVVMAVLDRYGTGELGGPVADDGPDGRR